MDSVLKILSLPLGIIHGLYVKAFNANKWVAGVTFSVLITTILFSVMVLLISLGDMAMKEDKSVKLADIVMPERQIDTFMTEVEKPEKLFWFFYFCHESIYLPLRHYNISKFY